MNNGKHCTVGTQTYTSMSNGLSLSLLRQESTIEARGDGSYGHSKHQARDDPHVIDHTKRSTYSPAEASNAVRAHLKRTIVVSH